MALNGKHAKDSHRASYGRHGVEVRPRVEIWQAVAAIMLVAALGIVPLSLGRSHIGLDSQAFADSTRTAFPELSDSSWAGEQVDGSAQVQAEAEASYGGVVAPGTADYTSRVTAKLQNSLMEGGCEIVSLAIALESMGLPADMEAIVSDHLVIDGHFATGYSGDPHERGAGYPAGIVHAANSYLASIGAEQRAFDLTGTSFEALRLLVEAGYPVLVWTTMDLAEPQFAAAWDAGMEWYSNEHCVVVYDVGDEYVLTSDPLAGLVQRDGDRFAHIYEQCGSMALVIF